MGPNSAPAGLLRHAGRTLTWASLNPNDNVFDFSYIDDVLAAAEAGDYGVVFRLKASVYDGSEAGQGGTQSQMIPQWVVDKYALLDGFTFDTGPNKTYAAPWHAGVQVEFYKLLQEFGRRRLLESPHLLAIYLHGVSSSAGEEMHVGESVYTDQASTTAVNAGYDGSLYGSPLADAIMDCWTKRMERWAEVAGPYVYKVAWVGAGSWDGLTYPQLLLDEYALSLGIGARNGFLEHYYAGQVRPPVAGQFYNGAYVTSDWTHPQRDGRFWGDENERTDVYKDPFNENEDLGAGDRRDLAYRSSFFRAAQLGLNFLWTSATAVDRAGNNNGDSADDALPAWFTLVAGKPAAESPDAAVWLREAQVRHLPAPPYADQEVTQGDPPQPFKNFEHLLMQRDVAGAVTQPAHFLNMPHVYHKKRDYNNPDIFGEYTARSTNVGAGQRKIAFSLDPDFRASLGDTSVEIKVTYFDDLDSTTWNVQVAKGNESPVNLGSVTDGTSGGSSSWKTATFTLNATNAPFEPGGVGSPLGDGVDFVISVPSGSSDLAVRYVRVVRTAEVAVAPRIKIHPISQPIPSEGSATLHVVPDGPAPYTYQWRKNGTSIDGATKRSLVVYPGDPGTNFYSVVVSNAFGSVTSNAAALTDGYVATVDDFDDGDVTSPPWDSAAGSGGVVTITPTIASPSEPSSPDGSGKHVLIDFGSAATWKYALIRDADYGPAWSSNGVNAIRFYLKGSDGNPVTIASDGIKAQIREDGPSSVDTGERWSFNLGVLVQDNSSTWTTITAPLSSFYLDGGIQKSGGTAGVLDLALINQIRFHDNSIAAPIKIRLDRIQAIEQ